jgi:hypothetical protein
VGIELKLMATSRHKSRQIGLKLLLGLLTFFALVMGISIWIGIPVLPFAAGIPILAWLLYRIGDSPRWLVITWAIGAEMFALAWQFRPTFGDWFPHPFFFLSLPAGCMLCVVTSAIFTVMLFRKRLPLGTGIVGSIMSIAIPVLWWLVIFPYVQRLNEAEKAKQVAHNKAIVIQIVKEIEIVRAKLGRAPKNTAELEASMGHAMPFVYDNGFASPISYQRIGENEYQLHYELWATDDWIYSSNAPQKGWVQSFY